MLFKGENASESYNYRFIVSKNKIYVFLPDICELVRTARGQNQKFFENKDN